MIRIMIVEDEPPTAKSISLLVKEHSAGALVVHTATNGKRALEYLQQYKVDIIFSDIKMPVMDGIELAKRVQESYPEIVMIIISGYEEFELARSAMSYGIRNYLLKPISRPKLYEALDRAMKEISMSRLERKRRFFEAAVINKNVSIDFSYGEKYGVIYLCAGNFPIRAEALINDNWYNANGETIEEYSQMIFSKGEELLCIGGRSMAEKIVVFSTSDPEKIYHAANGLYQLCNEKLEAPVSVLPHFEPVALENAGLIFSRLRKEAQKKIRLLTDALLDSRQEEDRLEYSAYIQEMIYALKSGEDNQIHTAVNAFVRFAATHRMRQNSFTLQLERLMLNHFEELEPEELDELKSEIFSAITNALSEIELAEEISGVFIYWIHQGVAPDRGDSREFCEQVASYIKTHHRRNITTTLLAKEFGFSSTQLSKRFKQYFGVSISEYVANYRILLAQALMKNDKTLMVKEVAREVGFNDQYYFSKIFKKKTGMWPTEFLNI